MLSSNVKNIEPSQANSLNSSSSSPSPSSLHQFSSHSSNALRENLPESQSKDVSQIQANSFNPEQKVASGAQSRKASVRRLLVNKRLNVAQQALLEVKTQISGGSTNLSYGNAPLSDPDKRRLYSQPVLSWRFQDHCDQLDTSTIDKLTLANCEELSFLVWQKLMRLTWKENKSQLGGVRIVSWIPMHVCIVLGQTSTEGKFPDNFSKWDRDAVICEPWADFVCLATEYPKKWQERMEEWALSGIKITTEYTPSNEAGIEGQWMPTKMESPTDKKWLDLPNQAKTMGGIDPKFQLYKPIYDEAREQGYEHVLTAMWARDCLHNAKYFKKFSQTV